MIQWESEISNDDLLREIAASSTDAGLTMARIMERVGWEVVGFLRSIGHGTQPPARPGEPSRSAHPGQWSDITSNLANAYRFELYVGAMRIVWMPEQPPVPEGRTGVVRPVVVQGGVPARWNSVNADLKLVFLNGMEYAAALEAKQGYWVLREITEAGGPVVRAIRKAMAIFAPDARLE